MRLFELIDPADSYSPEWKRAAAKGLPMDKKSRMDRAAAMGFDINTVWYHGTADDIPAFLVGHPNRKDNGWLGAGIYFTTNQSTASAYTLLKAGNDVPNVVPVYLKLQNPYQASREEKFSLQKIAHNEGDEAGRLASEEWSRHIKSRGHDGVFMEYKAAEVGEVNTGIEVVVFNPDQIRSINAVFDPDNINSSELLEMWR